MKVKGPRHRFFLGVLLALILAAPFGGAARTAQASLFRTSLVAPPVLSGGTTGRYYNPDGGIWAGMYGGSGANGDFFVEIAQISTSTSTITPTLTVSPTASSTATLSGGTGTPSLTPPTATSTLIGTIQAPTSTIRATQTFLRSPTTSATLNPTVTETPTPTTTFVPLPKLTLLFPVLTPTTTPTYTPTPSPTRTLRPEARDSGRVSGPPLGLMGGVILLAWATLAAFLVAYLRRLGY